MPVSLGMPSFLIEQRRKQVPTAQYERFMTTFPTLGHCDCGAQQQQWFLFDPLHAYAEYIIEYEYLFSVRISVSRIPTTDLFV